MKLIFGTTEIEIKDYFDSADFKNGTRRFNVTVKEPVPSIDELYEKLQGYEGVFSIVSDQETLEYSGFSVLNATRNGDDTSLRTSISFEKLDVTEEA